MTVQLSTMGVMKALAVGQLAHFDEVLHDKALEHCAINSQLEELQERLFELDREIILAAMERERIKLFLES